MLYAPSAASSTFSSFSSCRCLSCSLHKLGSVFMNLDGGSTSLSYNHYNRMPTNDIFHIIPLPLISLCTPFNVHNVSVFRFARRLQICSQSEILTRLWSDLSTLVICFCCCYIKIHPKNILFHCSLNNCNGKSFPLLYLFFLLSVSVFWITEKMENCKL